MEPFIADIVLFAGNFAPRGWAFCQGQLLPIAQNTALFSILGTTYGGDGRTTFGLPDFRGRLAVHPGRGPGLTPRILGQKGGVETVTLVEAQMPQHNHTFKVEVSNVSGEESNPTNKYIASKAGAFSEEPTSNDSLNGVVINSAGGGQPHSNMQPYLTINYIIALMGVYPSRS